MLWGEKSVFGSCLVMSLEGVADGKLNTPSSLPLSGGWVRWPLPPSGGWVRCRTGRGPSGLDRSAWLCGEISAKFELFPGGIMVALLGMIVVWIIAWGAKSDWVLNLLLLHNQWRQHFLQVWVVCAPQPKLLNYNCDYNVSCFFKRLTTKQCSLYSIRAIYQIVS